MKTKGLIFMLLALCILPAKAERIKGNGNIVTKEIRVGVFDAIQIKASIEFNSGLGDWIRRDNKTFPALRYRQTESRVLTVQMDENLFSHLRMEVSGGCLTIQTGQREQLVPTYLKIEAGSKELKSLKISGSLDFILESSLSGESLEISISGSGDVTMKRPVRLDEVRLSITGSGDVAMHDLRCTSFTGKVSGSGDISLKGKAQTAEYKSTGSGDIDAYGFQVDELICTTSGSGDIDAYAVKTLKAKSSGSGDISYRGPAKVEKSSTGSGDIEKD